MVAKTARSPSVEELSLFVEFAPAAMAMVDKEMRYVVVNNRWRVDLALGDQELIGRSHYEVVPDMPAHWLEVHRRCLAGATQKCDEDRFVRADGTVTWQRWEVHPWRDAAGQIGGLLIFGEDITARKNRDLAMLESATREQQRLGRDLHDGLGQELAAISLLTAALAARGTTQGASHEAAVAQLSLLAQRAVATCRAMAHGLSPLEFSGNDLTRALREMLSLQLGTFGLQTHFDVNQTSPLRLDRVAQENLYRIAQEAVSNARLHAHANLIQVVVEVNPRIVRLEVRDDGSGMPAQATSKGGIGIKVMSVRAGIIGARLSVEPGRTGGTTVLVECPQPQ